MDTLSYKTKFVNKATANKEWFVIDAQNEVVGRLSTQIAMILRGKTKPSYTPHADCGDNVIIINAEKVRFTGKKMTDKEYIWHTGYPGGQRFTSPKSLLAKDPTNILRWAIMGMLPKTRLGREIIKNLYIYVGTEHPHEAQKPTVLNLNTTK